jgi:hypothetical protein
MQDLNNMCPGLSCFVALARKMWNLTTITTTTATATTTNNKHNNNLGLLLGIDNCFYRFAFHKTRKYEVKLKITLKMRE